MAIKGAKSSGGSKRTKKGKASLLLETSPDFWRLIEKRRKQPMVTLEEMRKRLTRERARQ